ncbi:DNA repair protein RecN [Rhabdothermincola salaria]|uniref:DNA repair protein RecN n=1 Tax=Rhabdothermincola salaria TaxID=2903142 RepID=UPI001E5E0D7C|nr:DNA repair protein RecN [Rhabdothermincola salaria]MCD9623140.1 DNA repair protein RecN [Rhabdothermincola salaria]
MLLELRVSDLGVIDELSLVLGSGMTAVTGETGAGKTLVVTAIELLVGGRAETTMVRPGASEAVVEGRFVSGDDEVVLRRVVPAKGRTRAYVDGRLATLAELAERGAVLVDLHGQHDHQSLLAPSVQRRALDRFAGVDLEPLRGARKELAALQERLGALGGDARERAREIDLLRFQVAELDAARLTDPDEEAVLAADEDRLGDAVAHREAAARALEALTGDRGATDALGEAVAAVADRGPFEDLDARLAAAVAEVTDLAVELRSRGEQIEDDPERQATVRERRQLLVDLKRKYGDTLAEVMAWRDDAAARLAELEGHDELAARLDAEAEAARRALAEAEEEVAAARRAAAPGLAAAVESQLPDLALGKARVEVDVSGPAGREVTFRFAANPGMALQPLAKVASGGELARAMLALRLVLSEGPPVLVFDEVDAGIGGAAALAVGRSLASLGDDHQVLVVTHLAQVASWAHAQVVVDKVVHGDTTRTTVAPARGEERVTELARMLSGSPDSATARQHARELLDDVTRRSDVTAPSPGRGTGSG